MLSQRESYAPLGVKLPPPHDIATQTSPLHVGIAESVQSTDAEHVVTTAAVITMVFPVKEIVKKGTAIRRRLLVPGSSPMHGAVGSWSPPSPSSFKLTFGYADFGLHFVYPFLQLPLINLAIVHCPVFEVTLEVLFVPESEVWHSAVEVPCVLLFVLEALDFFCTCLPMLQTSSQFAWPHVHGFFALLGSIPASGLHVVVQSFVNHAVNHASCLHVSCG